MAEKLTFLSKNKIKCPVCEAKFSREELFTGRGRLIAGDLTNELRRLYEPSQKYGEVFPLIYTLDVCPECYYASFQSDFTGIPADTASQLFEHKNERMESITKLVGELDFNNPRSLREGAASYYLAMHSYEYFPSSFSPAVKQGLCTLRAAWLFNDLHAKFPSDNYDYVARIFYRKAAFFYTQSVENESSGKESVAEVPHLGPDLDKNYGYDGILYLSALLEYKYGSKENLELRRESLSTAKRTVARIFGMGKASKNKPAALLNNSKDLHDQLTKELAEAGDDA
ncbi:MAG: DUF2225 domain-containing protein [Spirochaetales bacterium]|nr:DUF2225 domain-containing protein [Spirochaetales bacterium]